MRSKDSSIDLILRAATGLGLTQTLTQISTSNLPGDKVWPARKTDNLTAIGEVIVQRTWKPRRLTTLWASMACHRDRFTIFLLLLQYIRIIFRSVQQDTGYLAWQAVN
jgi:hypothetical protein